MKDSCMKDEKDLYDLHCKGEFDKIDSNFKKLFEVIEGNGKPGLKSDLEWCVDKVKGMMWVMAAMLSPVLAYLGFELIKLIANGIHKGV
jgi:hypothetical protein